MREIKFRGKRLDNGEWVYGYYLEQTFCDGEGRGSYIKIDGYSPIKVDSATVGQFTGLYSASLDFIKDPNKEAYIGDIIRFVDTDGREFIKLLSWSDELCCVIIGNRSYQRIYESGYTQPSKLQFEIIGNIHDNPELLKP